MGCINCLLTCNVNYVRLDTNCVNLSLCYFILPSSIPGVVPVSTPNVTAPVSQAPVPTQANPVPSEPSPNSPSTPPKLTPAADLRARTPQISTPPLDPAPPPLLSKPRERNSEMDHNSSSNTYVPAKAPELTAQSGSYNLATYLNRLWENVRAWRFCS